MDIYSFINESTYRKNGLYTENEKNPKKKLIPNTEIESIDRAMSVEKGQHGTSQNAARKEIEICKSTHERNIVNR